MTVVVRNTGPRTGREVVQAYLEPPAADPESSLIGTIYEGYPADAPLVVSSPKSWVSTPDLSCASCTRPC